MSDRNTPDTPQSANETPTPGVTSFSMAAALGWTMLTVAGSSSLTGNSTDVSREQFRKSA